MIMDTGDIFVEQTLQIDIQELEAQEPPLEKERENRTCWLSYHHWHQPEHIKNHLLDEVRLINQRSTTKQHGFRYAATLEPIPTKNRNYRQ